MLIVALFGDRVETTSSRSALMLHLVVKMHRHSKENNEQYGAEDNAYDRQPQ